MWGKVEQLNYYSAAARGKRAHGQRTGHRPNRLAHSGMNYACAPPVPPSILGALALARTGRLPDPRLPLEDE